MQIAVKKKKRGENAAQKLTQEIQLPLLSASERDYELQGVQKIP